MCRFSHVRLTPEEKKEVRKLSGVMIPIYASVALVLFAVVMLSHLPRSGEAIAIAKNSPPVTDVAPAR
jgi:hypothetical protein